MRLQGLITDTPNEPPVHSYFGFCPAVELRDGPLPGELIEVAEDGRVIGHWEVPANAVVIEALNGRSVTILPGYPQCARALRDAGAEVTVYPWRVSALELAQSRLGDVDYL